MGTRFASGEALAAHVAAQNEKIQETGDEMTALQDEVASGTATPHGGRICVPASMLNFLVQEKDGFEGELEWISVGRSGVLREV